MTDSQQLIAEYARNGSDAAFRELVTRYINLVYSTALRLVEGDTHRAEDVAQTVFVDLARLARTLSREVMPGGWLHRHTCFVAANTLRGERRRQSRERQAVEMNALQNHSGADFSQIAPLLDEAINELGEADRTAILLRFFEQHDFRSVGQALGSNEDAARMRVTRALEKLETLLKRRGVTASSGALAVVLGANAVQAALVGLAATLSTAAALAGVPIAAATTAKATVAAASVFNAKTVAAIIAVAVAAGVGTHLVQQREANRLRRENQNLIAQQTTLTSERDAALAAVAGKSNELERLRKGQEELLRLRGQVGVLRAENSQLEKLNRQLQAGSRSNQNSQLETDASLVSANTNNLPLQTFTANVQANVPWNQAVVTGGWKLPSGNRAALMVRVEPKPQDRNEYSVLWFLMETRYLEFSETAADRLGLGRLTNDRDPTSSITLSADQYNALLTAASGSEDVRMLTHGKVMAINGNHFGIPFKSTNITQPGTAYSAEPYVDMHPTIAADGQSVDLKFVSTVKCPSPAGQ
jgi:RNA polymerase sigma factor (sigma-70 family)